MRIRFAVLLLCGLVCTSSPAFAQRPGDGDKPAASSSSSADAFVARMMKFNKSKDGKLTKDEITDKRLLPLFERADANHDGVVTADELKALYAKEGGNLGIGRRGNRGRLDGQIADNNGPGDRRGPPDGAGPDDRGGPGGPGDGPGRGPGGFGPGGPGGFGGPPQPGQILPDRLQEMLKLTDDQKKEVADLQKDVDAKLAKILTADQQKQLKEMRNRRPPRRDNPDRPEGGPPRQE
jgi:EF hand